MLKLAKGQVIIINQVISILVIVVFVLLFFLFMQDYTSARRTQILKKIATDALIDGSSRITQIMRTVENLEVSGKFDLFPKTTFPSFCRVELLCEESLVIKISYANNPAIKM